MPLLDSDQVFNQKSQLPGMLDDIEIRPLWAARFDLQVGNWNLPKLVNDFWRVYQNDASGGRLISATGTIDLEPHAVYIIPAGLELSSRNEEPITQFFIHFEFRGIPPIAFEDIFPGPVRIPDDPLFSQMVSRLGERVARDGCDDVSVQCMIKGILYESLGQYLGALTPETLERCWARVSLIKPLLPALQWIQENLDQRMTNAEIAALCHMSEGHFIRRFREATSLSPVQYILKRRVASAAQQLLFTSDSIDQIAEQNGFADRFYFSRIFLRETGRPPAAFRRGHHG
ncbi:MAG: AraC family transcriptional regulator [Capsulimonas sp.]|jgi:AraC-like DNA-binding protein|uniref:AraC family transcriptional regulator n=1 Tax=Capsulimonas sp. TaxID=2494211 RepID=UPI003264BA4B|nr:hypothetical protein [Capsulimonas sp.]